MNRWHRALQGFATDLAGTVLVTVAGFVATPIILSLTSQSLYGFWVLTLSIVGYMALLEFGVGMALTRHVASDIESRTPKELNALIATAFSFLSILGAGLFLVGFICSFFVPGWLGVPEGDRQDVVTTFRFALFSAALALPMSAFSSIIVGFNRMALDNTNRTVVGLMSLGLSILLLKMGLGLVSLAVAAALGVATIGLINALICRYMIPQITVGFAGANVPDIRRVLAFGGAFQVGRIANIVALSTDSLVLGLRLGTAAVTPYILTLKLANLLSVNLASKVPIALFPAVSSLYGSGNISGVRSAFAKVLSYSVRLAACSASLVLLVNEEFVTLWVGASNYGGVQLTVAFAVLVFFDSIYRGTGAFVYASGDLKYWAGVSAVEAAANIIFCIVLAGLFGAAGVAWATILARAISSWWLIPLWLCRRLQISVRTFLLRVIMLPLLRSVGGVSFSVLALRTMPVQVGWGWVISVVTLLFLGNLLAFEAVDFLFSHRKRL